MNPATKRRVIYGSLGGLLPSLVNLAAVDLENLVSNYSKARLIVYAGRVLIFLVVGGAIAGASEDVGKAMTLTLIGIGAPGLVTSGINAANLSKAAPSKPVPGIVLAYAGQQDKPIQAEPLRRPEPSWGQKAADILLNSPKEDKSWAVVVYRGPDFNEATRWRALAADPKYAYSSTIYELTIGPHREYGTALTAWVTAEDAGRLADTARKKGLASAVVMHLDERK